MARVKRRRAGGAGAPFYASSDHGARMGRARMAFASASPGNSSAAGSQRSGRPRRMQILPM